jgi:tripeptidyl-peptidase-2
MVVVGGDGCTRVNLCSVLRLEVLLPEAKLNRWIQRLRPISSDMRPCPRRHAWSDGRALYQVLLTYKVQILSDNNHGTVHVMLRLPTVNDRLYESPFESQLVRIFDSSKKLRGASEAYPKSLELTKGTYTVKAQVRPCLLFSVLRSIYRYIYIYLCICIDRNTLSYTARM